MKTNILIMGKSECTLYSAIEHKENCIIISINDTNNTTVIYDNPRIIDILRLEFDDITKLNDGLHIFNINHARLIKNFIDEYKDTVSTIIVHCTAGISRSAAVGCCISRYLNGSDTEIIKTGQYMPNIYVYKLLSKVFNLKCSNNFIKDRLRLINRSSDENLKGYKNYGLTIDDMFIDDINGGTNEFK